MSFAFPLGVWSKAAAGVSSPAFGAEITRGTAAFTTGASYATVLTGAISSGTRIGIIAPYDSGVTISGVTPAQDSQGNTYQLDKDIAAPGGERIAIISGVVTTSLGIGDTVTINYSASQAMWRGSIIFNMTNTTALDVVTNNNDFGTAVTASATTSAKSVIIGAVSTTDTGATTSGADGTISGAAYNAGNRCFLVYKNDSSTGAGQSIGVTLSSSANWAIAYAAYK